MLCPRMKDMIFGHFNVVDVVAKHCTRYWFYVFDLIQKSP